VVFAVQGGQGDGMGGTDGTHCVLQARDELG
jgi:hypothetical protein